MLILNNNYLIETNLKISKSLLYYNKDINFVLKLNFQNKRIKDKYFIKT